MRMRLFLVVILMVLEAAACQALPGSITGRVTDQTTREGIPGAVVAVVGSEVGANTDLDGYYTIGNIEPGYYNVRATMMSYKTIMKNRVMVRSNTPAVLDIELEPNPLAMQGIVVKPSFFEKTKDAPVSAQKMDFEEIISQPGGSWDVQRAVQALPAVVSGADQSNEIIVRGGNYGENLFVIDNIEVQNPNHFAWQGSGGGPVTMINTDYVRQLDFMAGAFPAQYGGKASSVLDIKYREGLDDRLHAKLDLGMAGYGANLEGPLGPGGNFMISGHKSFLSLVAGSFGLTAIPYYYDVQGKAVYNFSPRFKLSAIGIYGNDWIDIDPGEDVDSESDEIVKAKSHQYLAGGTLNFLFDRGYAGLTLSRTRNYWYQYVTDTSLVETWKNRSTETEDGAKLDISWQPAEGSQITAGTYLKRPENLYDAWMKPDTLYLYYPGTDSVISSTGYVSIYQVAGLHKSWKYGGYIQYRHDWGNLLTTNTGVRFDRFAFTDRQYLSPRLGASLHLNQITNLNLAYGRCYQPPEWFQLAADTANYRLKSKYTDQLVAGLERILSDDTKASLEAYLKNYHDVPVTLSSLTADPNDWNNVYVNQGRGYARGLEFFLQKKVKRDFWGTLSYAYSVARAQDPRDPSREFDWDFDYRHVFSLIGGYRRDFRQSSWYRSARESLWYKATSWLPFVPADESEISFKWRYLGGRPYTPQTYHPEWRRWTVDPEQSINSARMKPYQRFDLHIQKRWYLGRANLLSYFDLENAFNVKNVWGYGYNQDGSITTIYQFGLMLIGGVVVEF